MHILHYFMYSCIISHFLDESSNLKAGCQKDVVHDAFDAIYVSYIDNCSRDFFMYFLSPSSGNGRQCPLSTSGTSGTLCVRPARTEVGGATVKGSFSKWCLGLSVVAYSRSSAARLSVIQRCLFLAVRNMPTLLYHYYNS